MFIIVYHLVWKRSLCKMVFQITKKGTASLLSSLFKQVRMNSTKVMEEKISINGINLNYVRAGQGNGEKAVLLMPGALGSAFTDFKPQIDNLPHFLPNFNVIAWDPPGYGKSIPPNRQFTKDFFQKDADYAVALMKKIGFDKFSILGWSDGGITGMILAAKYSDLIEKLVIWGSNAYIVEKEIQIYESKFYLKEKFPCLTPHYFIKGIRDVNNWSPKMREPMEKVYGAENFAKLWSDWVDILVKIYHEEKGEICSNCLHKIKCPTFILHGSKDPMIAEEHTGHLRKNILNTE